MLNKNKSNPINLKQAVAQGKLDDFIAQHPHELVSHGQREWFKKVLESIVKGKPSDEEILSPFLVQPILNLIDMVLDDIKRKHNTNQNPDGLSQNRERPRRYRQSIA